MDEIEYMNKLFKNEQEIYIIYKNKIESNKKFLNEIYRIINNQ